MIRVLIVDDSPSAAQFLAHIISSDTEMEVAGIAGNGADGLRMAEKLRPDIISMDINMPIMDGFETTHRIMSSCPMPIVIVSSLYDKASVALSFKAMEAGALNIINKPSATSEESQNRGVQELLLMLKAMAGVRVIKRTTDKTAPTGTEFPVINTVPPQIKIVCIGASTGGPPVIQEILAGLPANIPVPILVVQHITPGFGAGFTEWLNNTTGLPVQMAAQGELPLPGHVYIAPDNLHLELSPDGRLNHTSDPPCNGVRPSISKLFHSTISAFRQNALGILLTGMGRDGAKELKLMRDSGAITIAQDQASSVVFGMPGEAVRLGGATHILPAHSIAKMIECLVNQTQSNRL